MKVDSSLALAVVLRHWLVDRQSISSFSWSPSLTPFSSVRLLSLTLVAYLSLTLLLSLRLGRKNNPIILPPPLHRLLSSLHNLFLLLLSLSMFLGCSLSSLSQMRHSSSARWLFCFPPGTVPAGPVFFWAHIFYLSKLYELLDTFLILLSPTRKPLSFLHVFHHAVVPVMSYLWLAQSQSLLPIALITNAGVHVVMYGYYLSCSVGLRWPTRWKKAVTRVQILQFVFGFAASAVMLCYHFAGGGCEGIGAWVFNAAFNAALFALFLNFNNTAYSKKNSSRAASAAVNKEQ